MIPGLRLHAAGWGWVRSLVRELDPACCNSKALHVATKIPHAATIKITAAKEIFLKNFQGVDISMALP